MPVTKRVIPANLDTIRKPITRITKHQESLFTSTARINSIRKSMK